MADGLEGQDEPGGFDGFAEEDGDFDWSADEEVFFLDDEDGAEAGDPDLDRDRDFDLHPGLDVGLDIGRTRGRDGVRGNAAWLGEERLQGGRDLGRGLPPVVPQSRVMASLLALAVFLGCTGSALTAAYHRHVTDRRIANTLALSASDTAPRIPGLAALGHQQLWQAKIEERVVIPVINHSPKPVMLLSAVLEEPGMTAAAEFEPVGAAQLAPGQTGSVDGEITVDCTQDPAAVFPYMDNSDNSTVPLPNTAALLVRARTEGGHVGEAALNPDANGPDLQLRICQQEGFDITGPPTIYAIGDARTHSVVVTLTVASSSDITMGYRASVAYTRQNQHGAIGPADTSPPEPLLPATGTVRSGATIHVSFTIHVLACPIEPKQTDGLYVELMLTAGGNPVDALEESTALALPLTTACGQG
jgi:hypothetical protein